jgi:class 3 adenylate cyclase
VCGFDVFGVNFSNKSQIFFRSGVPLRFSLSALLVASTLALAGLARHVSVSFIILTSCSYLFLFQMDKVDRVIFMWKTEVIDQKEKASDMRRRNEKLVYNVLPMHVAEHFMGNRKRQHDELYSQSYAEVGVLFASMPNFSDFYTEESVNNQGLECLRFLNEVISDYDAMLELPQFQDIFKIKTIGSTYMAASGLNPARIVKADEASTVRWAHLALLVEFALELKKALQGINEQSFNHFVLKMGINHGPITAGVIGARKPHYDIWGNTVNVASRMESTGKAGAIQVTEETCEILQPFGYTFEQRGLVAVKGKGELMTYYLQGKIPRANLPPSSPILACVSPMETVQEVDETREVPSPITPPTTTFSSGLPLPVADNEQQPRDSPVPHLTSISSASTTSPNSVRLNQDYVEMQATDLTATATTTMSSHIPTTIGDLEKSTNDVTKSSDESEVDVQTPLLRDNDDATSTTPNSFSIDEKDSLLDNEN